MVKKLFPTLIYENKVAKSAQLNKELIKEISHYQIEDTSGRKWSAKNYVGGYTSYNSITNFHKISPNFAELEKQITKHVNKYTKALDYNFKPRKLVMTTCWVNVMPANTYHPLHIHPLCVVSGTYYVQVPKGCSSLKIEDTKMSFLMSAPPRNKDSYYYHFKPEAGALILFESWVRHEVPPNLSSSERISVSFNYEWL